MRVSKRYKFVFLANTQCASSSVRKAIDPYCDYKSGPQSRRELGVELHHHHNAKKTRDILTAYIDNIEEYFFFSTIRNPWDRIVSRFKYDQKNPRSRWAKLLQEAQSFEEFACARLAHRPTAFDKFMMDGSEVIVRDVAKVENLDEDMERIASSVGLPKLEMPHLNINRDKLEVGYRSYYSKKSEDSVRSVFKYDIERFEYEF